LFDALARLVIAAPKRVLAATLLLLIVAAALGAPVSKKLSTGGFVDPGADSTKAAQLLIDKFGRGDVSLLVLVRAPGAVDAPPTRKFVEDLVAQLRSADHVTMVTSPWDVPDPVAAGAISRDKHLALVVAGIGGGENQSTVYAAELAKRLSGTHDGGIAVSVGGAGIANAEVAEQTRRDLAISEAIALPISFAVLIWVFGGLIAALIPLTIGVFAIVGCTAILRLLAEVTDISAFALNVTAAMGLALAIDYSLLIVSRYREEVGTGAEPEEAIRRTIRTAARTVLYSAVTVGLSLAAMAIFPMPSLRSLAYAGVAVVVLAALASVLVAPAAILVFSKRIAKAHVPGNLTENAWYRWTRTVMRRPTIALVATAVPLLVLALPFLDARFGLPDERLLPSTSVARQVGVEMRENFNQDSLNAAEIVVPEAKRLSDNEFRAYVVELSRTPGVTAVVSPDGTYVGGAAVGPATGPAAMRDGSALLTVTTPVAPFTSEYGAVLNRLHAVAPPGGVTVWFGGPDPANRDSLDVIVARLPAVLATIAIVTFALLLALTGSIVIPLKALVLNVLSLSATFGALVWIFQEGNLGGLGTAPGPLIAVVPVLLFCVAFGLSMDYEVFLISRMREHWVASDQTRAANEEAVALGLASTARVVTAAALIMAISFAALIASQVSMMRITGVGLTLAVLVDAMVIRTVLLPAAMALLGKWNWWAPPLLRSNVTAG
jgi:RND superfamily putative drug exporter